MTFILKIAVNVPKISYHFSNISPQKTFVLESEMMKNNTEDNFKFLLLYNPIFYSYLNLQIE